MDENDLSTNMELERERTLYCRCSLLIAMNTVVKDMNHEGAYDEWIRVIPDQANEDDLEDCAMDDDTMQAACKMFNSIVRHYGRFGYDTGVNVFGCADTETEAMP